MTHCRHCGSHEDKYVMLYVKGSDQPAQIDLWTINSGEHICVGSFTFVEVPKDIELKPIFICAICHSVISNTFIKKSSSRNFKIK